MELTRGSIVCTFVSMPRMKNPNPRPPGRPQVYDWDTLLDGKEHRLSRGVSFTCTPASLKTQAYSAAKRRGVRVTIRQLDDVWFSVQATTSQGRTEYDWDRLLDGEVHQLRSGVDFSAKPQSFQAHARQVAASRGLSVSIKRLGDTLFLQAKQPKPNLSDLPFEMES